MVVVGRCTHSCRGCHNTGFVDMVGSTPTLPACTTWGPTLVLLLLLEPRQAIGVVVQPTACREHQCAVGNMSLDCRRSHTSSRLLHQRRQIAKPGPAFPADRTPRMGCPGLGWYVVFLHQHGSRVPVSLVGDRKTCC
jgi:hypothetical protein